MCGSSETMCLKILYPGSVFLAAVNSRIGTQHPLLTLAAVLCVKDFHQKEKDSRQAFTDGFDGPLSRPCGPKSHISLSLQPVILQPEDVIQLLDLVCDVFNFFSLSDHRGRFKN